MMLCIIERLATRTSCMPFRTKRILPIRYTIHAKRPHSSNGNTVSSHSHGHVKLTMRLVADESYVSSRHLCDVNQSVVD